MCDGKQHIPDNRAAGKGVTRGDGRARVRLLPSYGYASGPECREQPARGIGADLLWGEQGERASNGQAIDRRGAPRGARAGKHPPQAVWSFWSKPFREGTAWPWGDPLHFLLSWVLSVELGRRWFASTSLVTDQAGAELLVERLQLDFDDVSTELDGLQGIDARWWAIGKLYAYRRQVRPFVHIDNDVFLFKPLPAALTQAPVCAQSPECFRQSDRHGWYRIFDVETYVGNRGGWLPVAWRWYSAKAHGLAASCCGILGGTHTDFLTYYADLAIRMIEDPRNQKGWAAWPRLELGNILVEQYLLNACAAYGTEKIPDRFGEVSVQYLFDGSDAPFDPNASRRVGYTHLLGAAKQNPSVLAALEQRVARDWPAHYKRCVHLSVKRLRGGA